VGCVDEHARLGTDEVQPTRTRDAAQALGEQMNMKVVTLGDDPIPKALLEKLTDVMAQLYRVVPVKFDGVDEKVTIKSMVCNDALMFSVLSWLDDAAGVYFDFSENGIRVTSGPPVAP
jgi:hypothetical protein